MIRRFYWPGERRLLAEVRQLSEAVIQVTADYLSERGRRAAAERAAIRLDTAARDVVDAYDQMPWAFQHGELPTAIQALHKALPQDAHVQRG